MSLVIDKYILQKAAFLSNADVQKGAEVLSKITALVNHLGKNFNTLNGGELSEIQSKLAGYKFYLADHVADLMSKAEYHKAWLKDQRAQQWDTISDEIKATDGKVKNKEQIENILQINLSKEINDQLFYESEWQRFKLKSFAIDDILTAIVQRIAELKKQIDQSKM